MKIMSRRIIALALAFFMVVGMLPSVAFARTPGKDGSAAMNEDYEAKTTLMPIGPSFSVDTLLEWTAESDPDAAYSRASIPLKERVEGFVVNPQANPEAKLMLCSLANSDHDHTSAQGTESFLSYAFNYWQYVESCVYWSGSLEGSAPITIIGPKGVYSAMERLVGYLRALSDRGILYDDSLVINGPYEFATGYRAMETLLGLPDPPTAIFTTNYDFTIALVTAARERGINIPEELDIFGFDCVEIGTMMQPPLPVVHQPEQEIGRIAAEYMIQRLEGYTGEPRVTKLKCKLNI